MVQKTYSELFKANYENFNSEMIARQILICAINNKLKNTESYIESGYKVAFITSKDFTDMIVNIAGKEVQLKGKFSLENLVLIAKSGRIQFQLVKVEKIKTPYGVTNKKYYNLYHYYNGVD